MSNWPAAVVFDFDGVIVNSEPVHFAAFLQLFAEENIALSEREYYSELIGFDDRGVLRHIFAKHRRPMENGRLEELKAHKLDLMRQLLSRGDVPPLNGVDAFVRGLARHYPLAICSGAVREEIEIMLEGVGLKEFFPVIVAADDVTVGKPDPSGYLLTVKLLGEKIGRAISPAEVLVIEDAPIVIESVRNAGFSVLGVATSYPLEALGRANWATASLEPAVVAEKIPQLKMHP